MRIPYPYLDLWHQYARWFNPSCALCCMALCWLVLTATQQHTPSCPQMLATPSSTPYTHVTPPEAAVTQTDRPMCPRMNWLAQAKQQPLHWQRWAYQGSVFTSLQDGNINAVFSWLQTLNQQGIIPQSLTIKRIPHQHTLQLQLQLDCSHETTTPRGHNHH